MARPNLATAEFAAPEAQPSATGDMAFLNHLRFVALGCRAKARADLFSTCAGLALDPAAPVAAHADALMRCLGQAFGTRPLLFRPGTEEVSFDEAWLMQLGKALARGDEASAQFLLTRRVAKPDRRLIRFLVGRVSESFGLN